MPTCTLPLDSEGLNYLASLPKSSGVLQAWRTSVSDEQY